MPETTTQPGAIADGLPRHASLSQLQTWAECGESYRLKRVLNVVQRPAWWFPGGIAVHSTIEDFLRQRIADGPAS